MKKFLIFTITIFILSTTALVANSNKTKIRAYDQDFIMYVNYKIFLDYKNYKNSAKYKNYLKNKNSYKNDPKYKEFRKFRKVMRLNSLDENDNMQTIRTGDRS